MDDDLRALAWIGNSQKELRAFPEDVKDVMGYALHLAQTGSKHDAAKPLAGFGGAAVRDWHAVDGVHPPAGEGRRLRARRDRGAQREGRKGPARALAAAPARAEIGRAHV